MAEQRFPLPDAERSDGEGSWRHFLEFYGMRKASHRLRHWRNGHHGILIRVYRVSPP
jgi:hypothetical protein